MKTTMRKKQSNIQKEDNKNIFQNLIDFTFIRILNKYLRKKSHAPELTAKIWLALLLFLNVATIIHISGIITDETLTLVITISSLLFYLVYFSDKRIEQIKERWDKFLLPSQKSRYGWFTFFYFLISVVLYCFSYLYLAAHNP